MQKNSRFELSHNDKIRRSIYVFLRDELERKLQSIALEEPYRDCQEKGVPYPYVDSSEMRPRKKEFAKESAESRPFFIIFCEDYIDPGHQKYIRFADSNKGRKDNIQLIPDINLHHSFVDIMNMFQYMPHANSIKSSGHEGIQPFQIFNVETIINEGNFPCFLIWLNTKNVKPFFLAGMKIFTGGTTYIQQLLSMCIF